MTPQSTARPWEARCFHTRFIPAGSRYGSPQADIHRGEALPPAGKPRLLDQVREAIRTRPDRWRTEHTSIQWIKLFIVFHNKRQPRAMGAPEVALFLSALAVEGQVSAYDIPFRRPSEFPQRSLLAARVALIAAHEGWCSAFAKAAFLANFAEDRDIGDPSCIERLLAGLGKNGEEICKRAEAPENKGALRQQTEIAQQYGIFGAPSFRVGSELFWGDDRLDEAIAWARKGKLDMTKHVR